jgi:hypothetical protein
MATTGAQRIFEMTKPNPHTSYIQSGGTRSLPEPVASSLDSSLGSKQPKWTVLLTRELNSAPLRASMVSDMGNGSNGSICLKHPFPKLT